MEDKCTSSMTSDDGDNEKVKKKIHVSQVVGCKESEDIIAICSGDSCNEERKKTSDHDGWMFEEIDFHLSDEEIRYPVDDEAHTVPMVEPEREKIPAFPSASLNILINYAGKFTRLNGEQINITSHESDCNIPSHINAECHKKLSTDTILRFAAEKFIQCPIRSSISELSTLGGKVFGSFSGISEKDKTDLELVFYLLASAEKVGEKQFDRARKILDECDKLSSRHGDPVQRLVYYFSEALREKIDYEMGKTTSRNLWGNPLLELQKALLSPNTTVLAFHQVVPFSQVAQFSSVQAILDHVSDARKIHIIDLAIRSGTQFAALMQAVAVRKELPVEHLKITAVGSTKSRAKLDETGLRLTRFAQSLNIPFSFEAIIVEDIDLDKSLFLLDPDEVVAIHSPFFLMTMLAQPDRLECLMRVIRSINPRVMIVNEVEGNHNSPVFVNRFTEALFFYGAFFDSLEDCMKDDESNRTNQESFYFGKGIRNILAAEGAERIIRHVNINVWRAFFVRFGMVEVELSMQSLDYAKLVRKNFACGNSCTVDMDGKCMMIGWKGTPLHSVSAWKFT